MEKIFKILFLCAIFMQTLFSSQINLSDEERNYLNNKKVLTVQNLSTFPPFNFNEDSTPLGYSIDYMKLIANELDIELKFIGGKPWREYLQMVKEGSLDIIPHIAITKERKEFIDFTNFNHIEYVTGLAIKKSDTFESMSDLKNKVIAVANKTFLHTYLKNNFPNQSLLLTSSTSKAVEAVSEGKADAVLGSLLALQYYIQKNWLSNIKTVKIKGIEAIEKTELPMGVAKGNKVLKSILEKANESIPYSKKIELKDKWLKKLDNTVFDNSSLIQSELDYLKKKKVIKICVLPDWLPFEQIDEKGKHEGIGNDIMEIISEYINTPIELVPTKEWSKSLQNIKDKTCDILPVAMNIVSRRNTMNFTKPYFLEPFVIATKNDKLFIKDISSLSNQKIGVVKSYAVIEVLKSKNPLIEIVQVMNSKEGLEKVSDGELFGYIDTMPTIGYYIQKYGMYDLKIAGKLDSNIALSIASRNDEPILNTIMQKALDTISQEEIRKIVGKWIEIKVQQEFDYKNLFYVTIVFFFIFITVLYKNRTINKANIKLEKANSQILQQQQMVDKYVQISTTDLEGTITSVNDAYCNTIGYTREELIGGSFEHIRHPDMTKEFFSKLWKTIEKTNTWMGEIKNIKKDGEDLYLNMFIEALYERDKKIGYRAIAEDITDKKRIEELSVTDKLTGLYNRLMIDELLLKQIDLSRRYSIPFSIILLDIDNFKNVNDTHGHDVGDFVLKKIAEILLANIRKTDEVGRWGGEEFIVICPNTNEDNSYTVAEHIRKSIEGLIFKMIGTQTVSLGVCEFNPDDTVSSLFKRVDTYLFQAKKEGKNRTIKS